jgi:hypothetical protein
VRPYANHFFQSDFRNVVADDLSTEKERTLGFLKRVVGADGSVKLDKDKVVRKLKGNADAARHKEKLGGIAKKMAGGMTRLRRSTQPHALIAFFADDSKKPRDSADGADGGRMYAAASRSSQRFFVMVCAGTRNRAAVSASSPLAAAGERARAQTGCVRGVSKATRARDGTGRAAASVAAAAKAVAGAAKGAEINWIVVSSRAQAGCLECTGQWSSSCDGRFVA